MLPIYSTKCHQKRWGISRQEETMAIYSPKEEHLQIHWHDLRNLSKHLYMNFFFCTWILEDKKRTNQLGTRRVKLSRYHRVTRLPSTWLLHLPSASLKIHLETGQSGVATQVLPESRRRTQGGQSLILNQHIDQYLHRDGSMAPCVRVQHPLSAGPNCKREEIPFGSSVSVVDASLKSGSWGWGGMNPQWSPREGYTESHATLG